MQHEDFLGKYHVIRCEEIGTLNNALTRHFNGEYHFENPYPEVIATYPNTTEPVKAKVIAVKAPILSETGIFLQTSDRDYGGNNQTFQVGYLALSFGDINSIIDFLPEPMKQYCFRWDGGNLPRRHEWLSFRCNSEAMSEARKFKEAHHIDKLTVWEVAPCDEKLFTGSIVGRVEE